MEKLKTLSLFAGIGGFDLGLERTGGFETVAFCEIDKAAQKVLRKHWPEVPIYDDARTLGRDTLAADGIAVDVICGGFPCQDISTAGRGAGIAEGTRSGLWGEYARLIGELRPRYVLVENVSALLGNGMGRVLGDLASLRYDAWWDCIPASALGAPHQRDRIWILAADANAGDGGPQQERQHQGAEEPCRSGAGQVGSVVAHAVSQRQPGSWASRLTGNPAAGGEGQATHALDGSLGSIWAAEPPVGRVAHGVPARMDRLKQLGNAVVPQIPELIGNAILASLRKQREAA